MLPVSILKQLTQPTVKCHLILRSTVDREDMLTRHRPTAMDTQDISEL